MRICFIGAVEFSRRALEKLIAIRTDIGGVCTLQSSPGNADHCDLTPLCATVGIPTLYAPDINSESVMLWLKARRPDVIFCFGWSRLIKNPLLRVPPLGVVGYHPAALPANRGRHPLTWALALGLQETASTFFFMDEGPDSGDILDQVAVPIAPHDDAGSLYEKVTARALTQIERFVPLLSSGCCPRIRQDHRKANVWRKRGKADGKIDWRMAAVTVHNLVRALAHPYVGAHFVYRGSEIKVWQSEPVSALPRNIEPGKVVAIEDRGIVVKCGEAGVRLVLTEPSFQPVVGEYL